MKFSEAISILEMEENSNEVDEGLVRAYRQAMRKYHPDVTELDLDFALEMSKMVNEAYSFLSQNMGKWSVGDKASTNIAGMMAEIYNAIKHIPHITIERKGVWLWVKVYGPPEFQANSMKKDLSDFRKGVGKKLKVHGFTYGSAKQYWTWHDGQRTWRKKGRGWSDEKINRTYGCEELETDPRQAVG